MTGITWGDDHIYTLVTRQFPEEGDKPITSSSSDIETVQIESAKETETKISSEANQVTTTE